MRLPSCYAISKSRRHSRSVFPPRATVRPTCIVTWAQVRCPGRMPKLTDDTNMATTLKETLAQLEALGNEKVRAQNSKNGAGDNQFGVRLGDPKTGHED